MAVNEFEIAVYTNTYTGTNSDVIMADGQITSNEYDNLFTSILSDFGLENVGSKTYWRYVTIAQPCYYISYSVSLLASMQLFAVAQQQSFMLAVQSYIRLIEYTRVHPEYTYSEVLTYAGLYDFSDEKLYVELNQLFTV
jgi:oligoendopeptidase F